jgi:hypothetical protein
MKQILNAAFVIIAAIGAFAFTRHPAMKKAGDPYPYYFSFDGNSLSEESDASKYTWLPDGPSVQCDPGSLHCVINANKDASDRPILSAYLVKSTKEMQ